MSWRCELFESRDAIVAKFGFVPVGAIYPAPHMLERFAEAVSPKYRRDWAGKRLPLIVVLPDGYHFCVDTLARNADGYHGDGWTVTGDAPLITLAPSINIVGSYHGWLRDGVITDDCEGRTFPNARGVS